MRILVIGGHGTIGSYVAKHFAAPHEVLIGSRTSETYPVDITDEKSIKTVLQKAGALDAIIVAAGEARWEPMQQLSADDYYVGIKSKLMGQVNVVRHGIEVLSSGGSITLTTGILADDPVLMTTSAAMVNGAIHSFARAAALEMPDRQRINVVCPGLVEPSEEKYGDYFPGHQPVSMQRVVRAYERSVLGGFTGEIIRIY